MNRRQKKVQKQFLDDEEAVIRKLKNRYHHAQKEIEKKAKALQEDIEGLDKLAKLSISDEEKEVILSKKRSKVYQKQYQDSLKKQLDDILNKMHDEEFTAVSEYLNKCYEEGFVGTLYDLQGQGIPLAFPLDQEAMVRAVQLDSKISQGLYSRLGEDVTTLKKKITAQVSRGIATGMTFPQIAKQLAGCTNIGYNNAIRIARTEGHRIQCQSGMDACYKAKDKGADVVKQWDSTLDAKTRDSHAAVDGEIRELDKPFSNGLMFPGDPSGAAAEVINCRCALLQRARWALEDSFTKMNNFSKQLETFESPEEYGEFKKAFFSKGNRRYMDYVEQMESKYGTKNFEKVLDSMNDREYKHYSKLLKNNPIYNTKSSISTIADAADFLTLDKYLQSQYNISVDDAVKALDFDTVKNALVGCESVIKEYPGLADSITKITTSKGGVMSCAGEKITFNPHYFSNNTKLVEDCKRMSARRWWIPNASPESIGAHESAHAIEWMMLKKNSVAYQYDWQRIDAWNKCTEAKKLVSQACKNIKKTPYGKGKRNAELIGGISRYGQENASETMAEAFADVYANGENANPLSIEIKRLTAEMVKNYERGIFP